MNEDIMHTLVDSTNRGRYTLDEPWTQLAWMPESCGASWHENPWRSTAMPHRGPFSLESGETSEGHVVEPGGSHHATPSLSR